MKGQAAVAIIVIVIIGVALYFFWPQINELISTGNGGVIIPEYENDIISVEDLYVSNKKPYADTPVTIKFFVKNNGDEKVEKVRVNFYDLPGFEDPEISCDQPSDPIDTHGCIFKEMESLEMREVVLTLKAPPSEIIFSPEVFKISYNIKYNHSGYRIANIPIIDGKTRETPMGEFSVSDTGYGPIVLDFELQAQKEIQIDEKIIKKYWAVSDQPLEVRFSFEDIIGKADQVNILEKDIKLEVIGPLNRSEPCDFSMEGEIAHEPSEAGSTLLVSTKNITVPEELLCFFTPKQIDMPETTASIKAQFNYTYEFFKSISFEIQPLPE
jgi:hypothetical protein